MDLAFMIFQATDNFPPAERFSLSDQVRRSSRSVPANISEAWRKRRYAAAFIAKLSDAEAEAAETQTHIEIARRCGYFDDATATTLDQAYEEILSILVAMAKNPQKWCPPSG